MLKFDEKVSEDGDAFTILGANFDDERGRFRRIFCENELKELGIQFSTMQVNFSSTSPKGCVRGLHFQSEPSEEAKIVTCLSGTIYDVIIDVRKDSPNFLRSFSTMLDGHSMKSLYIPAGFAHGFQTLTENVFLIYCHSEKFNQNLYNGLNPLDPKLNIKWPLEISVISKKDKDRNFIV